MKKIILLVCLCLISYPVWAGTFHSYAKAATNNVQNHEGQDDDTQGSDDFYRELIAPEYGSDKSPAFLNRDGMNPNEDSYGYGSTDGVDYDNSDDSFDSTDTN